MAQEKKEETKLEQEIKSLTKTQKETYDKLKAMNLKNVTGEQLVKAAQEFGANVDGAVNYLAIDDPDGANDEDPIGEPNFLTALSHSDKVQSVDKKQVAQDNTEQKDDKK